MQAQMSPEAIDAAIIQLNSLLDNAPNIPQAVKDTGKGFVQALDTWADDLRTARESAKT